MMRSYSINLIIVLVLVMVVFAACSKPYMAERRMWNTPTHVCLDCHNQAPGFKAPQISKHAEIHCLECHAVADDHENRKTRAFTSEGFQNVIIREARCIVCHPTDRYSNPGHFYHLGQNTMYDGRSMMCIDCHKDGHALSTVGDCSKCHHETVQSAQTMATGHCVICHGFRRTAVSAFDSEHHNYNLAMCIGCHQLGGDSALMDFDSFDSVIQDPHIANTSCSVCHSPHSENDPGIDLTCRRCHTEEDHLTIGAHTIKGHMEMECTYCHTPHRFKSASCDECHGAGESPIATILGHRTCSDCHPGNDYTKFETNSCANCHGKINSQTQAGTRGHRNCNSCHVPHQWDKTVRCSRCHTSQAQMSSQSKSKTDCSLCHTAHDWKYEWKSCTDCHAGMENEMHVKHFDFGCDSCHAKHNWFPTERSSCTECHPDMEEDHYDDSMLCTLCHSFK